MGYLWGKGVHNKKMDIFLLIPLTYHLYENIVSKRELGISLFIYILTVQIYLTIYFQMFNLYILGGVFVIVYFISYQIFKPKQDLDYLIEQLIKET